MDTLISLVLFFIILGIIKDIILLSRWFEKWVRSKEGNDPKSPATLDKLEDLLFKEAEHISYNVKKSFDAHFQSLIAENKKTNDLLSKFLYGQKIIAKNIHGIDLDV